MSHAFRSFAAALLLVGQSPGVFAQGADRPTQLPGMIVTGDRSAVEQGIDSLFRSLPPRDLRLQSLAESPGLEAATSIIGAEEIRWRNTPLLLDAMQYVPGAWTENRGRKEKQFFSVRGQRYPYPDFLIDGAWFRSFTETAFHFSSANLGQIQALRSSAGVLLTPESLGGAINLQPREYRAPETQIDAVYGTHATTRSHVNYGRGGDRFGYALGAGYYHTDGPAGRNARENVTDWFGRVQGRPVEALALSLTAFALYGDRQLETALAPADAATRSRIEAYDPFRNHVVVAKARLQESPSAATELIANFAHREYEFRQTPPLPTAMERDWEYGMRLTQTLQPAAANTLRFSGLFSRWECPTGKRFFWPRPADLSTYTAAVVDEQALGRATLNLAYRLSRTYYAEFGGYSIEGTSGRLSTVRTTDTWEDPLHTLSAGASMVLDRHWTLLGNSTWGQVAAPLSALTTSLTRPENETRTKLDLGLRGAWPAYGEITLTAFGVDQRDTTIYANDTRRGPDGQPVALVRNGRARSHGLEFDTRTRRFDAGTQLFLNFVAMRTELQSAGRWIRDREVPQIIWGGGLAHRWGHWELTFLAKRVGRYENDRFVTPPVPQPLGDFLNLGTQLAYWFGPGRRSKVHLGADNLRDRRYSTVNGYPHAGRTVSGGVSLVF
jgi:hypothetical protein